MSILSPTYGKGRKFDDIVWTNFMVMAICSNKSKMTFTRYFHHLGVV